MAENLFCPGQMYVTDSYKDGWFRTFKGHPPMNDDVKKMLYGYAKYGDYAAILLFLCEKAGLDQEYSGFILREVIRGYI